ncbi:MAG: putative Ig proteinputative calcium-binding proteinFG-GAP repeat protein [Bacteroidetes bacterium]|jgi:hypothetical protein|nr:putative Ig proteinputative calcium-binding proteinFG-GAP repeat protein [Bacteroidota bacterium]
MKKNYFMAWLVFSAMGLSAQVCFTPHADYPTGTAPYAIVAGDFNNDGNQDLAVTNAQSSSISVFSGAGNGTFGPATPIPATGFVLCICKADFNGDNFQDIAFTSIGGSAMNVALNDGTGGFSAVNGYTGGTNPVAIGSGDFNADGFVDIVLTNSATNVVSLYAESGTGAGTYGAFTDFNVGVGPIAISIADLNGDNIPDVITYNGGASGAGDISVLIGTGAGSFATAVNYPGLGIGMASVTTGDFDLDGDQDIAIAHTAGSMKILFNDGSGVFGTPLTFTIGTTASFEGISCADFDSDGNPDLVASHNNAAVVVLGDGAGNFGAPLSFSDPNASSICTADFNNDTKADIATANYAGNNMSVLLNNALPVVQISASDSILCPGDSLVLSASGATLYAWNPASVVSGASFFPAATNTYILLGLINGCWDTDTLIIPVIPPDPVTANVSSTLVCPGNPVVFTGSGASSYVWTDGVVDGVPYNVDSTNLFTVTGTDTNGCHNSANVTVSIYTPPTPDICRVTVDSLSLNNVIYWDKTLYPMTDTFYVYRDTANNAYGIIGKLPYDSLSEFADTLRSLYAANGDPNVSSWRYKIAIKDTCGNLSPMSLYHQSIFMQNSLGNFVWSEYRIEGQSTPVAGLNNYIFKRDNISNGNYTVIQVLSASSTFYTDPNYSTFVATGTWRTETTWSSSCTSTMRTDGSNDAISGLINTSRSNVRSPNSTIGIKGSGHELNVSIYPVPANSSLTVDLGTSPGETSIDMMNTLGQSVYSSKTQQVKNTIDCTGMETGVYFITVRSAKGQTIRKIVIQ